MTLAHLLRSHGLCIPVLGGLLQILSKSLYSNKSVIRKKKWSLYMQIDEYPVGALFSDPCIKMLRLT